MTLHGALLKAENGKHYMTISNVQINSLKPSRVTINIRYNYIARVITRTVNRIVNANWKVFQSSVDPTFKKLTSTIIESILKLFLDNVAFEDIFTGF